MSDISKFGKDELLKQLRALRAKDKASAATKNDEESSHGSSDEDGSSLEEGSEVVTLQPSDGSHSSMSSADGG